MVVAVTQLFGNTSSNVNEANFETVFGGLHEGVFAGIDNECAVSATAVPSMDVDVDTGTFVVGGVFGRIAAAGTITIGVAHAVNPRIDRVILKRDNSTGLVTVEYLAGTAAVAPVPPPLDRTAPEYECSLAQIYVPALAVAINPENVWDERRDSAVCGMSSGKVWELQKKLQTEEKYPFGCWQAYGSGTTVDFRGLLAGGVCTDVASFALLAADGIGLEQDTAAAAASVAFTATTVACTGGDLNPVVEFSILLPIVTELRFFAGLASVVAATMLAADNPVAECAGIQFCIGAGTRGDTNWMYRTRDNAAGVTLVDSGVVADNVKLFFRIELSGTEAIFTISDANHNVIGSGVIITNLPTAVTNLYVICGIEARSAAIRAINHYRAELVNQVI